MKKFEIFLYEDRNESNGEYIGTTKRYIIEAKTDDEAIAKAYRENRWARGCWCHEIQETETYGIAFNCKCYGNHILSEERVFIKAKTKEQARRYYNDKIKGKRFNSYTKAFTEDGDVECGTVQEVYIACGSGQYDATNY